MNLLGGKMTSVGGSPGPLGKGGRRKNGNVTPAKSLENLQPQSLQEINPVKYKWIKIKQSDIDRIILYHP